jgi:hypothetical protein
MFILSAFQWKFQSRLDEHHLARKKMAEALADVLVSLKRSVASTNSDIMPNVRHDSGADHAFLAKSGDNGRGSLAFSIMCIPKVKGELTLHRRRR